MHCKIKNKINKYNIFICYIDKILVLKFTDDF